MTDQLTIHTQPSVKQIGHTTVTQEMAEIYDSHPASFLSSASGGETLIEFAGRQCYESFHNPAGRTNPEYIANILQQRHFSVLEHANVTYLITQVSRSFTHDLVRHRHMSYSQLSQRYVDSTLGSYVCPPLYQTDREMFNVWKADIEDIHETLKEHTRLIDARHPNLPKKQRREAIRSLAPNSIETKIVVTGNLRSWLELISKRYHAAADQEIQEVASLITADLKLLHPAVFDHVEFQGD